jgi:hypothetical protein
MRIYFRTSIFVFFPLLFFIFACGIGSSDPTDQEITAALISARDGFDSVPIFEDYMAEEFRYNDTLDASVENDVMTISQNGTFTVERGNKKIIVEGTCSFDDYEDPASRYTINGTIRYNVEVDFEGRGLDWDVAYDLKYDGGKVESIAFSLNQNSFRKRIIADLMVNGKQYTVSKKPDSDILSVFQRGVSVMNRK